MNRSLKGGGAQGDVYRLGSEHRANAAALAQVAPFVKESIADAVYCLLGKRGSILMLQIGSALRWDPWAADRLFKDGIEGYIRDNLQQPVSRLADLATRESLGGLRMEDTLKMIQPDSRSKPSLVHSALRCGLWLRPTSDNRVDNIQQTELYGVPEIGTATMTKIQINTSISQVTELSVATLGDRVVELSYRQGQAQKPYAIHYPDIAASTEPSILPYTAVPSLAKLQELHRDLTIFYPE